MPTVWIPPALRDLTGGNESVSVAGANVLQAIEALDRLYPGTRARLCVGGSIRPGVAIAVDTELAAQGLLQPLSENSEVHFLPAIGGG